MQQERLQARTPTRRTSGSAQAQEPPQRRFSRPSTRRQRWPSLPRRRTWASMLPPFLILAKKFEVCGRDFFRREWFVLVLWERDEAGAKLYRGTGRGGCPRAACCWQGVLWAQLGGLRLACSLVDNSWANGSGPEVRAVRCRVPLPTFDLVFDFDWSLVTCFGLIQLFFHCLWV